MIESKDIKIEFADLSDDYLPKNKKIICRNYGSNYAMLFGIETSTKFYINQDYNGCEYYPLKVYETRYNLETTYWVSASWLNIHLQ